MGGSTNKTTSGFSVAKLKQQCTFLGVMVVVGAMSGVVGCSDSGHSDSADPKMQQQVVGSAAAETYKKNCKVCHAQGINGAPILGNKKMWETRLPKGTDTLVSHAVNGFGLMPAKGGRVELSDEAVATVVQYMVSQVQ